MIVRIEFHGGCKDGTVIVGEDDPSLGPQRNPVHAYLFLSNSGQIGAKLREPVTAAVRQAQMARFINEVGEAVRAGRPVPKHSYPPRCQLYEVTDRRVGPDDVTIRLDYVGDDSEPERTEAVEVACVEDLNDFRKVLSYGTASWLLDWVLSPHLRHSWLPVNVECQIRIIDTMTAAERRHPLTLIDRFARERIAQEAGTTPEEVEGLVNIFAGIQGKAATAKSHLNATKSEAIPLPPNGAPEEDDLVSLPVRACVAFAVRCACRIQRLLETLDPAVQFGTERAIAIATEYASGTQYDHQFLHRIQRELAAVVAVQGGDPTNHPQRCAISAAFFTIGSAWAAVFGPNYLSLGGKRTKDNSLAAAAAAWAARLTVAADPQTLPSIWRDRDLLVTAVTEGRITAETRVPQSFFSANP